MIAVISRKIDDEKDTVNSTTVIESNEKIKVFGGSQHLLISSTNRPSDGQNNVCATQMGDTYNNLADEYFVRDAFEIYAF